MKPQLANGLAAKSFLPTPAMICFLVAALCFSSKAGSLVTLSTPTLRSNVIAFSFDAPKNQSITVQSATSLTSDWVDEAQYNGSGSNVSYSVPNSTQSRLFRVKMEATGGMDLLPNAPSLSSGDISLPDAATRESYSADIFPANGVPPFRLQVTGQLPDGVIFLLVSNETANASVRIVSDGASLIPGQRRQLSVRVTDHANSITTRRYDLRVTAAPPEILVSTLTLRAGEQVSKKLAATGGIEPLLWSVADPLPPGLSLTTDGILTGTPSADAAEWNENGKHSLTIQVSDSFTDRLTGIPTPRKTTQTADLLVRLSYLLNIQATRLDGPSFRLNCSICHSSDFKPDIQSDATALIDVFSGSGAECDIDRVYISPRDASDSLIYQKVAERNPCGERMPFAGPYFTNQQIDRLARWIRELQPGDTD